MKSCDTSILLYYFDEGCKEHESAREYLLSVERDPDFVLCDLVLAELFVLLQNKKVFSKPRSRIEAWDCCAALRNNPRWQILEYKDGAMAEVWRAVKNMRANVASHPIVIYDLRLGFVLKKYGVTEFATRNTRDFKIIGFKTLLNPIVVDDS